MIFHILPVQLHKTISFAGETPQNRHCLCLISINPWFLLVQSHKPSIYSWKSPFRWSFFVRAEGLGERTAGRAPRLPAPQFTRQAARGGAACDGAGPNDAWSWHRGPVGRGDGTMDMFHVETWWFNYLTIENRDWTSKHGEKWWVKASKVANKCGLNHENWSDMVIEQWWNMWFKSAKSWLALRYKVILIKTGWDLTRRLPKCIPMPE